MSEPPKTGYKSPPLHSRFQKGVSGNPSGRPKRAKPLVDDLHAELNTRVELAEGGRRKRLTKQQIVIKQLISSAARGDTRALALIIRLRERDRLDATALEQATLSVDDQDILERYLNEEVHRRIKEDKS